MAFEQYSRTKNENQKFVSAGTEIVAVRTESSAAPTVLPRKLESATITFAAATTGAVASHALFTVTGVVDVTLFAVVGTDVVGSGTIEVGTALSTAGLLAQVAGTALDANEIWHDGTPDSSLELDSVLTKKIITQSIAYKIATDTLTGGTIKFYLSWTPISSDGNVVLA
jgi:hypothetical protein